LATSLDSAEVLELFHQNVDLVRIIARKVALGLGSASDLDELTAFGQEGLLDAARRFDPSRGVPFRAYANYRIRGAMLDGVRKDAPLGRRLHHKLAAASSAALAAEGELEFASQGGGTDAGAAEQFLHEHLSGVATAAALGLLARSEGGASGAELTSETSDATPEELVARARLMDAVMKAIQELPADEAELVRRHYFEDKNLDAAGEELGMSKSWASRLHARAVTRLGKRLRAFT
jgi:RNA polymerase sigma factor for flagellar operon FliA